MRVLRAQHDVVGLDVLPSPHTDVVGSVTDGEALRAAMAGADAVLHTATLHKPHVGTHSRAAFVQANVAGTLAVLEQALAAGVDRVVMTSTTSAYGRALTRPGAATWIDEDVRPLPRNVYGVTKTAAEDLCELVARDTGLPVVVLRTSRFFPEGDGRDDVRAEYSTDNTQVNELLSRRVDVEDVVAAHRCAIERATQLGFARYVISATTPFTRDDLAELLVDAQPWFVGGCRARPSTTPGSAGGCSRPSTGCTTPRAPGPSSAGAALGPRARPRAARRRPAAAQRARAASRRQGLPRRLPRAVHLTLNRTRRAGTPDRSGRGTPTGHPPGTRDLAPPGIPDRDDGRA